MSIDWLSWSNPVAIWWGFLVLASAVNIALWLILLRYGRRPEQRIARSIFRIELMILLCAAYVFGCAFRSVLPRADVQRIVLFDTWLSSVMVGRTVATIAEVCFIIQWALVLRYLADLTRSNAVLNTARLIVPLILLAEFCSWYAVVTTSYLGNTIENSIWAATFVLIALALLRLMGEFHGLIRLALGAAFAGIAAYVTFLAIIDVPMYFSRWQADLTNGKQLLDVAAGLYDVSAHWVVTHDFAHWQDEIAWMSLYFSAAVWSSLALCCFGLVTDRLAHYRIGTAYSSAARRHHPSRSTAMG
jgi:hypothetical protein